jgi:hypothetical protein
MNIIFGVCSSTVILLVLGLPFGLAADIGLILMFFHAAKELRNASGISSEPSAV